MQIHSGLRDGETGAAAPRRSTGARVRTVLSVATTALVIAAGFGVPAAAAAPNLSDPVLNLKFEDNTTDSSPKLNNATVKGHNGSTTLNYDYVPGVAADTKAIRLKGNTWLDLGTSVDLQPADLTLSFWINPNSAMSGEQVVTWNKQAYNSDGFYLSSESNTVPLALSIGPSTGQPYKVRVAASDRAAFFPSGSWTHIVVTYDKATKAVAFYRNGEQIPTSISNAISASASGVLGSSASLPKTIGFNGPSYNGAYLNAGLDEYKVFNGVANLEDVINLYQESGRTIDRQAIAQSDANGLSLPATATLALVLSKAGSKGSTIRWVSSKPEVISTEGVVVRPEEGSADSVVTLTAKVSYAGGPVVEKSFDVTVLAKQPTDLVTDSGLENVDLSDAYLTNAAAKEHEYLLSLSSKKFLYEFYKISGLTPPTATGYTGWERSNAVNFRGHTFGHYMSALAMSYASTKDPATKAALLVQINDAVNGLKEVQDAYAAAHPASAGYVSAFAESALDKVQGTGTSSDSVLVPWYIMHKILAGLVDINQYVPGTAGTRALDIASQFGEYSYNRLTKLTAGNISTLLGTEYGGMNDVFYKLFEASGGNPHFKKAAEIFDETTLFEQLAAGNDVLNGKHANTTIPKIIGALKRYTTFTENETYYNMLTEAEKAKLPMYLAAAQNFFTIVVNDHTYITGANSQSEHFHGADTLYQYAAGQGPTGNAQTSETCNEYNMLKLSRELFKLTKDVKYADFYENAFINTILASQNPETGMTTYFQPMASGFEKIFGTPFTEFWCCIGSGMENFSKLGDSIYFKAGKSVYVNMFFSSSYDYGAQNLRLTQVANMPNDDKVTLTVDSIDGNAVKAGTSVRLRVPNWIAGNPTVTVNGSAVSAVPSGGYILVPGIAKGDKIEYTVPMKVTATATPDNANFVAFKYGPTVLSANLGTYNLGSTAGVGILVRVSNVDPNAQTTITAQGTTAANWIANAATNLVRVADSADGKVQFKPQNTADAAALVFTTHYTQYKNRYGLYMNVEEPDSAAAQARVLADKVVLRTAEQSSDNLTNFDNNNFEADKGVKSANSTVGLYNGRQYRDASGPSGFFSWDLTIDPTRPKNYLQTTYYSGDNGRSFDIYINDEKLKNYAVTNAGGANMFYNDTVELPAKYLTIDGNTRYKTNSSGDFVLDAQGKKIPVVTVRFQSTGGLVGGVFGIRILRTTAFDTAPELAGLSFDKGELTPAFSPSGKQYTLTVPGTTTEVKLNADPHTPSGLVKIGDILFDDTQLRTVTLSAGSAPTDISLKAYAQDHTTFATYTVSIVKQSDSTPPAVSAAFDPATRLVTITATDEQGGSGLASAEYRVGSGAWSAYTAPFAVGDAAVTVEYRATDVTGNVSAVKSLDVPKKPVVAPVFTDVPTTNPFYADIRWMAEQGLTTGTTTGNGVAFQPGAAVSRQAFAAFLYRIEHDGAKAPTCTVAPYSDVPVSAQFCGEIAWLKTQAITTGFEGNTFKPGASIERQAMAAFLFRFANPGAAKPTCTVAPFSDVPVGSPFCGEISWLKSQQITTGNDDGTFKPGGIVQRQAAAAFLHRLSAL